MISWWRTSFGSAELENIRLAVESEQISQGPVTAKLEAEMAKALDVPYTVATTSGSMALLMSLLALDIKPGDEVIVPNRTFIATAHAALLAGARVVLVDTRKDLPILDAEQLERRITPRTKAIMPVHLNGRATDMTLINEIAAKHRIAVVEDAAQAIFSKFKGRHLGTIGDYGCYSLGMTKLISSGQGGIIATRSEENYRRLKLVRNHGVVDTLDADYTLRGFNGKITDLQSAAGLAQLEQRHEKVNNVTKIYQRYAQAISELPFLKLVPVAIEAGEVPLWVEVLCEQREELMSYLLDKGTQTRKFLPNLHHSKHLGNDGAFPNSMHFERDGLFLPAGPAQPMENIERVIAQLQDFKV